MAQNRITRKALSFGVHCFTTISLVVSMVAALMPICFCVCDIGAKCCVGESGRNAHGKTCCGAMQCCSLEASLQCPECRVDCCFCLTQDPLAIDSIAESERSETGCADALARLIPIYELIPARLKFSSPPLIAVSSIRLHAILSVWLN